MADKHLQEIRDVTPSADGCEECLKTGSQWVQLRMCLTCGHVGCCDSSEGRHATGHFRATAHPIMQSIEPGQSWRWCYVDEAMV
ncbi:MAG TPA: UBP-type zinc finger domain-containing protein [Blastocatellia bacterium]|nr:UBP-type zinc finger domain-containing protein [Blastocatellia bacterium]